MHLQFKMEHCATVNIKDLKYIVHHKGGDQCQWDVASAWVSKHTVCSNFKFNLTLLKDSITMLKWEKYRDNSQFFGSISPNNGDGEDNTAVVRRFLSIWSSFCLWIQSLNPKRKWLHTITILSAVILAKAEWLSVKIQIHGYLEKYSFNSLENTCDVVPFVSAITSDGSRKPKKSFIFLAGFGCPWLVGRAWEMILILTLNCQSSRTPSLGVNQRIYVQI